MSDKNYSDLINIVQANSSSIWDICEAVWEHILNTDTSEREQIFLYFLSNIDFLDVDVDVDYNFKSTYEDKEPDFQRVYDLAKLVLKTLVVANPKEDDFYHSVWEKITDPILLSTKTSQIAFLVSIWLDTRIPYFQLEEGCSMENEEFSAITSAISPFLKKANFIINTTIKQRTQRASLLMKIADEIEDEKGRIVYWAQVIARSNVRQDAGRINEILKKISTDRTPPSDSVDDCDKQSG